MMCVHGRPTLPAGNVRSEIVMVENESFKRALDRGVKPGGDLL